MLFCAVLAGLIVRTHVMEDDRWGFSMFRDANVLQIRYYWVFPDGTKVPHDSTRELRGDARQIRETRGRDFILGMGAAEDMIGDYVDWMWRSRRAEGASGFRADLRWQRYGRGMWQERELRAP